MKKKSINRSFYFIYLWRIEEKYFFSFRNNIEKRQNKINMKQKKMVVFSILTKINIFHHHYDSEEIEKVSKIDNERNWIIEVVWTEVKSRWSFLD